MSIGGTRGSRSPSPLSVGEVEANIQLGQFEDGLVVQGVKVSNETLATGQASPSLVYGGVGNCYDPDDPVCLVNLWSSDSEIDEFSDTSSESEVEEEGARARTPDSDEGFDIDALRADRGQIIEKVGYGLKGYQNWNDTYDANVWMSQCLYCWYTSDKSDSDDQMRMRLIVLKAPADDYHAIVDLALSLGGTAGMPFIHTDGRISGEIIGVPGGGDEGEEQLRALAESHQERYNEEYELIDQEKREAKLALEAANLASMAGLGAAKASRSSRRQFEAMGAGTMFGYGAYGGWQDQDRREFSESTFQRVRAEVEAAHREQLALYGVNSDTESGSMTPQSSPASPTTPALSFGTPPKPKNDGYQADTDET